MATPPSSLYTSSDSEEDRRQFGVARALPTRRGAGGRRRGAAGSDSDGSEFEAAVAYLESVRLETAAVPAIVVADAASVRAHVASKAAGAVEAAAAAPPPPARPVAAAAVAPTSPWLPAALDAFTAVRDVVLAARDAAEPDPLSPSHAARPPPPPPPRLPSGADPAGWPRRPPPARALATTPQPSIVDALVCVADACGGGGGKAPLPPAAPRWAFALAANLEPPFPPLATAALARLAAAAGAAAAAGDGEGEAAAAAAVVAAVAGAWFGQCPSLAAARRAG